MCCECEAGAAARTNVLCRECVHPPAMNIDERIQVELTPILPTDMNRGPPQLVALGLRGAAVVYFGIISSICYTWSDHGATV